MKINDIIVEGILGGIAGAAKGIAQGVKEIPGKAVAGYKAGTANPVQQAPGYQPGAIKARTGAQQYTQDIANAIRAGATGDISAKTASSTPYDRAPVGTKINQWSKTNDGWVNSNNNKAATPIEAETLDRKWYAETQKELRSQQAQKAKSPVQTTTSTPPSWDPKKKILTKDGLQYKKTTKGWQDIATDELVDLNFAAELQTAFDQASGRAPVTTAAPVQKPSRIVGQVTGPGGIKVVKWSDGVWEIPDTNEKIKFPNDIKQLEILLKQQRLHTGGKRSGILSPTPSAVKQRQARAAKKAGPAVFTSNRR